MASVNKVCLREQVEALKAEYHRLYTNGTLAKEACALFQAMLALLMAVFMETEVLPFWKG